MDRHILIESVSPCVDGGRYAAKSIAGESCVVEADIFRDGHAQIRAVIQWKRKGAQRFEEAPMLPIGNDRFRGEFPIAELGPYVFTIEAWTDSFGSWHAGYETKVLAKCSARLDVQEGIALVHGALARGSGLARGVLEEAAARLAGTVTDQEALEVLAKDPVVEVMASLDERVDAVRFATEIAIFACRPKARFSTWYEFFPRSESGTTERGATLRDAERRLPKLRAMGFDVVYLPPVHPIGTTHRKGKNGVAPAAPSDPGSPWAIGSSAGGHTAIEPALGTLEDFDHFVAAARSLDIDVALDFAIQCSPDHPWIKDHPEWFEHRADGSIRHAENPPFVYEDVCRVDFDTQDRVGLYTELYRVLMFWIARGVTIFRVDNPHTKPVTFWEWVIGKVQASNPEVIFLAEAFTRPKMMKALAKAGFTQSYTYFTWRNDKREIEEYLNELTQTAMRDYFVPNFFTNTHDVLPEFLQKGGPPAFRLRLVLAAMLSPSYGIYSGYELSENGAEPGTEQYREAEIFEIKARDYDAPGNLNELIERLNRIRRENPALQRLTNLEFLRTDSEYMIAFLKTTPDGSNRLLVTINLDPRLPRHCVVEVPMPRIGRPYGASYRVTDLLSDQRFIWGEKNYVRLDPSFLPAHILLIEIEDDA